MNEPRAFTLRVPDAAVTDLRERLADECRAVRPRVHLRIPAVDGEALATVYREGEVLQREERGTAIELVARLPRPALGRLRRRAGILVFDSP